MKTQRSNTYDRRATDAHFDQLARSLARGTSRRQILKGFAAGLGGSVLSALGLSRGTPLGNLAVAHAAGPETVYLPVVVTDNPILCPEPTTCENKVYCSLTEDCRCIQTAEGEIRCGQVPSCSAQHCTTSADCANLGEGYFCDSPGSGCCSEGVQLCIAPCGATAPIITGTWTGKLSYEGQDAGIRFILDHEGDDITGRMLLQDPKTSAYLESGEIQFGSLNRASAYWETQSRAIVEGDFGTAGFIGTFSFPGFNDEEGIVADLALTRTGD